MTVTSPKLVLSCAAVMAAITLVAVRGLESLPIDLH